MWRVEGLASSPRTLGVLLWGDPGEDQGLLPLAGELCVRRGPGCCVRESTSEACTRHTRSRPQPLVL